MDKTFTYIIIDDEPAVRNVLKSLIKRVSPSASLLGEAGSVPEAVRLIHKEQPEIVFLDIEMPGYSGLQLLEFFNPHEIKFEIIFVTAFNEYAVKAFKLSAFDYLLKPVHELELKETIERYLERKNNTLPIPGRLEVLQNNLSYNAIQKIALSSAEGVQFIPLSEILYLEADGTYTKIHLKDKTLLSSKPLGEFEGLLQHHSDFFKPHRSYIINFSFVASYSAKAGEIIYLKATSKDSPIEIPLSRYRKKEFEGLFKDYKL